MRYISIQRNDIKFCDAQHGPECGWPWSWLLAKSGANKAGRVHPQSVMSQSNPGDNRGSENWKKKKKTIGQSALPVRRKWVRWRGVEKGLNVCKKCHVSLPEDSDSLKYNHCKQDQLGSGARRTKEPAEALSPWKESQAPSADEDWAGAGGTLFTPHRIP